MKQSQTSRPVPREHANHFFSIVRHTNAEKMYHQCGQLTHFHCTIVRRGPPHLAGQSHVARFPRGRVKSKEMYPYTRSTWSQTVKVVQHTVFYVQASKRLFYTYNTVVLFNIIIIIIIAVGFSAHAVAGSLAWIRMRHATCTR